MTCPPFMCALYDTILYEVSAQVFSKFICFRSNALINGALSSIFVYVDVAQWGIETCYMISEVSFRFPFPSVNAEN